MAAEHRLKASADLEQRNGRAVRHGVTPGIAQIFYYFADGSTEQDRSNLIDGKSGWLDEIKEPRGR